ncbi:hypothetical protein HAX54_003367, partial [Datura stramonium]|nr:hypothetical protein [Datura stramonium]
VLLREGSFSIAVLPPRISIQPIKSINKVGVHGEVRKCMLGCDAPFNPLMVESANRRGRKMRKDDSENDNDGPSDDGAGSSRLTGPLQCMEADLTLC